jgi:hypothetical protein
MIRHLVYALLLLGSPLVHSQGQEAGKVQFGEAYSVHVGPLLPNQIKGMTEIMPTLGGRYAFPMRQGHLELGVANANAWGTSYYNLSASFRGDFSLDDMFGLMYVGLDTHYYNPPAETFNLFFGGHVGGGFAIPIGDRWWLRTDMKFNMNPGTALYIGFGLEWRNPGGGGGGEP